MLNIYGTESYLGPLRRSYIFLSDRVMSPWYRAVARFFVTGGHYRECRRLVHTILSTCHEICLRKIDLEYENGKLLQVTLIKTTTSKENKSINRLDLSDSTGRGGQLPPLPPLPPLNMARMSIKSDNTRLCFKLRFSLKITRKKKNRPKTEVFEAV